jgi:hypothetical protein
MNIVGPAAPLTGAPMSSIDPCHPARELRQGSTLDRPLATPLARRK